MFELRNEMRRDSIVSAYFTKSSFRFVIANKRVIISYGFVKNYVSLGLPKITPRWAVFYPSLYFRGCVHQTSQEGNRFTADQIYLAYCYLITQHS